MIRRHLNGSADELLKSSGPEDWARNPFLRESLIDEWQYDDPAEHALAVDMLEGSGPDLVLIDDLIVGNVLTSPNVLPTRARLLSSWRAGEQLHAIECARRLLRLAAQDRAAVSALDIERRIRGELEQLSRYVEMWLRTERDWLRQRAFAGSARQSERARLARGSRRPEKEQRRIVALYDELVRTGQKYGARKFVADEFGLTANELDWILRSVRTQCRV